MTRKTYLKKMRQLMVVCNQYNKENGHPERCISRIAPISKPELNHVCQVGFYKGQVLNSYDLVWAMVVDSLSYKGSYFADKLVSRRYNRDLRKENES